MPWSSTRRLTASVAVGLALGALVAVLANAPLGVMAGIDVAAAAFVVSGVVVLWPLPADATRRNALREDLSPRVQEATIVVASVAGVAGIVMLLVLGDTGSRDAAAAVGLGGVFGIWAMLHSMYAARYAHAYYGEPEGGIDFGDEREQPAYRDFFYFSFNLGMTYQVSDTAVSSSRLRSIVLRHCLLSYAFGTIILAATINLVAGIVTR